MAAQSDSDFRSVVITETSRNVEYNFRSTPIPFECPETILSTPLSSAMPQARMESNSRVLTPIPFQSRVPTPYPIIDPVSTGKDWQGPSPENRMFSPSWGFESTLPFGQQFQGTLLPMATGNTHTVHHYAFPQTWHHAVTPQSYSSYNLHSSDVWYGDSPLMEGLGTVDVGSEVIEQDSKVTSSTEVSPWKPHLPLPPVSELLNASHGSLKSLRESISPLPQDETSPINVQPAAFPFKPKQITGSSGDLKEARTQTPWKLKKHKSAPDAKSQSRRKGKPRKIVDKLTYVKQKMVQKERERAIRGELQHLSTMLPCRDGRPSKKEILETAISHIMQLQENIREAYLQRGLKTEDLQAILQDNNMSSLNQNCFHSVTDQQNDTAMLSDASSSPLSPPELVIEENMAASSASPISELSSQGSEDPEEVTAKPLENGNTTETHVNHVRRPMNAFLWFSKQYRRDFKMQYPGRDNREISTILAKHWRSMTPEQKEPYKEKAREEMRRTRESHPDFKYCKTRKETGVATANGSEKQVGLGQGYRIGSRILRQRSAIICTLANGNGTTPVPKKGNDYSEQRDLKPTGHQPRVKLETAASETTDHTGTSVDKEIKMIKKSMTQNQDGSPINTCHKEQIDNSSHGGPSEDNNIKLEWPRSCDTWVQCENCKKWHMLPDDNNPASLPDKWYCCLHVDHSA